MPTALDRIQVLLQPEEYAEVSMLAKEERRSLASMAAVLINEAIKSRIREGRFTPNEDDPTYEKAKRRQVARAMGQQVQREEPSYKELLNSLGSAEVMKNTTEKRKLQMMKEKEAIEKLSI